MFAKTVDRRGHLALKRLATHFAIGDDLQAGLLLERNGLIHGPVFDLFEISRLPFSDGNFFCAAINSAGSSRLPTTSACERIM